MCAPTVDMPFSPGVAVGSLAMEADTIYTLVGYAGSALIVVSLSMTSVLKLRVLGLLGAITFLVYGLLIGAVPIVVTNVVIIGIHSYYLFRVRTSHEYFSLLEVVPTSRYLAEFFSFFESDIEKYFPEFHYQPDESDVALLVLRNMVPAAVLVGHPSDESTLTLIVDYAIPRYRDFKVGKYLLDAKRGWFLENGWTKLRAHPDTESYANYLVKMNFGQSGGGWFEYNFE